MRTLLSQLERSTQLDPLSNRIQQVVETALPQQWMRDLLHGVWLGHPLHPVLVEVPLGAWTSSAILDLLPRHQRAATTLITIGTAGAVPAIIAGWNDWASLSPIQKRVGLVHAASNAVAVALYGGSLYARLTGRGMLGRMLGWAGFSAASLGGYLGGHLAYKLGAAVNQSVPDMHQIEDGWHQIGRIDDLPQTTLVNHEINHVPVVVYRDGDQVIAMLEHCAHQGGPLAEGDITRVDGHVCVVCPWHGSTFRLDDGEVVHGPSGTDQQTLPTRLTGDMLEVRLP